MVHLRGPLDGHIGFCSQQGCDGCLRATFSAVVEFIWRMNSSECNCWDVLLSYDRYCPRLLILKIISEIQWDSRTPSISVAEDGLEMTSPALKHDAVPHSSGPVPGWDLTWNLFWDMESERSRFPQATEQDYSYQEPDCLNPFSFLLLLSALGILVPALDPLFSVMRGCDHS